MRRPDLDQFLRRPLAQCVTYQPPEHILILNIVEESAGMVEQLTDSDVPSIGHQPREPALHGVIERELAFLDELQHHNGNETLREASNPELIGHSHRRPRRQLAVPGSQPDDLVPIAEQYNDSRCARGYKRVHGPLDPGGVVRLALRDADK